MNEVVNLNKARKALAKAEQRQSAAENRVRHGRTKAEKAFDAARAEQRARDADGRLFPSK